MDYTGSSGRDNIGCMAGSAKGVARAVFKISGETLNYSTFNINDKRVVTTWKIRMYLSVCGSVY